MGQVPSCGLSLGRTCQNVGPQHLWDGQLRPSQNPFASVLWDLFPIFRLCTDSASAGEGPSFRSSSMGKQPEAIRARRDVLPRNPSDDGSTRSIQAGRRIWETRSTFIGMGVGREVLAIWNVSRCRRRKPCSSSNG